eukprot:7218382-Prymnesium_polylepis.1
MAAGASARRRRPTACCWMRRAPAWERCGATRSSGTRGQAACAASARCRTGSSTRRRSAWRPAARSRTLFARQRLPRGPSASRRCCSGDHSGLRLRRCTTRCCCATRTAASSWAAARLLVLDGAAGLAARGADRPASARGHMRTAGATASSRLSCAESREIRTPPFV